MSCYKCKNMKVKIPINGENGRLRYDLSTASCPFNRLPNGETKVFMVGKMFRHFGECLTYQAWEKICPSSCKQFISMEDESEQDVHLDTITEIISKMAVVFMVMILTITFFFSHGMAEPIAKERKVVKDMKSRQLNRGSDFLIVSTLLLATTVYDVEMTMKAGKKGAREGNPWARSFVERGRGSTYMYAMGINAATLALAYALFKSKNPDTQKYWIVLPMIGIAGHTVGGTLNLFW